MSQGNATLFLVETEDDLLAVEEAVEGYNKERLIWVLNLIVTIVIFAIDIIYIAVYYAFPRVRKANRPDDDRSDDRFTNSDDSNRPAERATNGGSDDPSQLKPYWGCPNEACFHLTIGSLIFLVIKVTVDIFFLRISYLTRTIMIMTVVMLRLLDASLVFNSSYLFFLWFKTIFSRGVGPENRSFTASCTWVRTCFARPTIPINEVGHCTITWIPLRLARAIALAKNGTICITSIIYGIAIALAITLIFNLNGEHFLFYEFQAVKYSLLVQTTHVCANLIVWSVVLYNIYVAGNSAQRSIIGKNVKDIREISADQNFVAPTQPDPNPSHPTTTNLSESSDIAHKRQAVYYYWISVGNFLAYTPFLWFYLIALMFKPNFLHDMLNMQGLIGFLGTLFDVGACVPVIVALIQDRALRLSFVDLIYCRYGGLRKSGNLELIT